MLIALNPETKYKSVFPVFNDHWIDGNEQVTNIYNHFYTLSLSLEVTLIPHIKF